MKEKGFIPLYLIIVLVAFGVVGGVVYYRQNTNTAVEQTTNSTQEESASPSATTSPTNKLSPSAIKTITPTPSKTAPTNTGTPSPTTTSTVSSVKKNTCSVNVINGKLNRDSSNPLLVTLTYSFTGYGNVYMTGAQWDFDNNGTWDTDMSQSNGTAEQTYSSGGTKNVRLQVKGSDGNITDVCSKSFNLAQVIDVTLKGQVYKDNNCNKSKEDGDAGISGVRMTVDSNGQVLEDLTSDSSGNYSFTKKISPEASLSLALGPADYNYNFFSMNVTLSKNNSTAILDVPLCYQ